MVSEILRTYVAGILSPTSWIGFILILTCFLFWKNKLKLARIALTSATILFILGSTPVLRSGLYSWLETASPKIPTQYKYVVVLGGKIFPNEKHPLSSQITGSLLSRLSYGVKLTLAHPESKLIVTGNGSGKIPEAHLMSEFAQEMGLTADRIIVEDKSMNTKEHPLYLRPILKNDSFLIVTSAYHMERALELFRAHGLEGFPAPTDYMNKDSEGMGINALIMRGENLSLLDRLMTEVYSRIFLNLTGPL